jgi:hypothetical protein
MGLPAYPLAGVGDPIEKLKQAAHPIDSSQQHQQIRIELIK